MRFHNRLHSPCLPSFIHRVLLALLTCSILVTSVESGGQKSPSLGDKMGTFLQAKLGSRIGGGECAHLAVIALQVVGADFTRTEPKGTSDYIWSSNRIARLTNGSQVAGKQFRVGDIVQFHHSTFRTGSRIPHHTQVVAAVDKAGRITEVYDQNITINGTKYRTVKRHKAIDLTKLTGGAVSIYRPVTRVPETGLVEFIIINNTNAKSTVIFQRGTTVSKFTPDKANTRGSFLSIKVKISGTGDAMLKVGNTSVKIEDGTLYEMFTQKNGQDGIRKLSLTGKK